MTIIHGDCIEAMAAMEPNSVDAIVTDPPYGLEFMGKEWDKPWAVGFSQMGIPGKRMDMPSFGSGRNPMCRSCRKHERGTDKCQCPTPDFDETPRTATVAYGEWSRGWAAAALRVAKPGAYLLAFGGTRTVHRMTVALEDAGWIIRDMLCWAYASGFPKSRALLKPAWEPIVMARKPGPLRELDIDGCRIGTDEDTARTPSLVADTPAGMGKGLAMGGNGHPAGRWPANVVLTATEDGRAIFDGGIEGVVGGGWQSGGGNPARRSPEASASQRAAYGGGWTGTTNGAEPFDTEGSYSRFFLIPKASRSDREPVLPGMLEEGRYTRSNGARAALARGEDYREDSFNRVVKRANTHPTVKPIELMRHLVRLVTPAGGVCLDPFLGSGTTALAAEQEGRDWIGIEREAEYVAIAEARLAGWQRGLGLDVA